MDAKQAAEPRVSMPREEFDAILAAKDAEIDFERGLTDKARETIERLTAEVAELRSQRNLQETLRLAEVKILKGLLRQLRTAWNEAEGEMYLPDHCNPVWAKIDPLLADETENV